MLTRKSLILIIPFLLAMRDAAEERNFRILSESRFIINGTTNVHSFSCELDEQTIPKDTFLVSVEKTTHGLELQNASIALPVYYFDCGIKQMNHDLQQLLDAEQYPHIIVEFTEVSLPQTDFEVPQKIQAETNIRIGPQSNHYVIDGTSSKDGHEITFIGSLKINLTDYGLEPPKRLLGIVRVRDEIDISFNISISELPF